MKIDYELSALSANVVMSAPAGFKKQAATDEIIKHSKVTGEDPAPLLAALDQIHAQYGEAGVEKAAQARALGAKEKMVKIGTVDTGARNIATSTDYTGVRTFPGGDLTKEATPGQVLAAETSEANSKRMAASKALAAKDKAEAESGALLGQATRIRMARQYLNGDKSVVQSLGTGKVGAANRAAVQEAITSEAEVIGMDPQEITQSIAEFQGLTAGERALGTRTASVGMAVATAEQMAPIAKEISAKIDRTQYPNLNSVLMAFDKGTGDENVVRLAGATNAIVNTYARAISPTGVANVSDKDHARAILEQGFSKGQYAAAVDQIMLEMEAERKAPTAVKKEFRDLGKTNILTEKKGAAAKPATPGVNGKGWKLHTDAKGNRAYVSPNGKSFEEVK